MKCMKKRSVLLAIAVLICFVLGLNRLQHGADEQGRQQLEDALRRAAVTCYASEGFYPPDVDYMVQHYGLQYDARNFQVHYEIFASNLMPEITVVEKS